MGDLISRKAAIEAMRECWRRVNQFAKPFEANRIMDCIKAVKELPAVDAIPVEWIKALTNHSDMFTRGAAKWVLGCWKKEQEAR